MSDDSVERKRREAEWAADGRGPGSVTRKLNTEGADLLTLAGVNDSNLIELSRVAGVKVSLRADTMTLSGPEGLMDRAQAIGSRMIETARSKSAFPGAASRESRATGSRPWLLQTKKRFFPFSGGGIPTTRHASGGGRATVRVNTSGA